MLVRAVATLDPLAPVCWPGTVVWPDGLGPALAAAQAEGASQAGALAGTAPEPGGSVSPTAANPPGALSV